MLPKKLRFITLCTRSIPHLPQSLDTSTGCGRRELSPQNPHGNFRDSLKSCKRNLTKSSLKTSTSLNLMIGAASEKFGRRKRNASETPMMFSFMRESENKNSLNSARNDNPL